MASTSELCALSVPRWLRRTQGGLNECLHLRPGERIDLPFNALVEVTVRPDGCPQTRIVKASDADAAACLERELRENVCVGSLPVGATLVFPFRRDATPSTHPFTP